MFAIAFDLDLNLTVAYHPSGTTRQAYREIERVLRHHGFSRVQQSVFTSEEGDLADLTAAMAALRELGWLARCVKDIRAFRVEDWSDFNAFIKGSNR